MKKVKKVSENLRRLLRNVLFGIDLQTIKNPKDVWLFFVSKRCLYPLPFHGLIYTTNLLKPLSWLITTLNFVFTLKYNLKEYMSANQCNFLFCSSISVVFVSIFLKIKNPNQKSSNGNLLDFLGENFSVKEKTNSLTLIFYSFF